MKNCFIFCFYIFLMSILVFSLETFFGNAGLNNPRLLCPTNLVFSGYSVLHKNPTPSCSPPYQSQLTLTHFDSEALKHHTFQNYRFPNGVNQVLIISDFMLGRGEKTFAKRFIECADRSEHWRLYV